MGGNPSEHPLPGGPQMAPGERYVTANEFGHAIDRLSSSIESAVRDIGKKIDAQEERFETKLSHVESTSRTKPGTYLTALAIVCTLVIASVGAAWALLTRTTETTALVNSKDIQREGELGELRFENLKLRLGDLKSHVLRDHDRYDSDIKDLEARILGIETTRSTAQDAKDILARINALEIQGQTSEVRIDALEGRLDSHVQEDAHPWAAAQHNKAGAEREAMSNRLSAVEGEQSRRTGRVYERGPAQN